jgi:hypothetical protein
MMGILFPPFRLSQPNVQIALQPHPLIFPTAFVLIARRLPE